MDLEIISVVSIEAVPEPEVEQPKKRKGWTLFRNKKQKNQENVQKVDDGTAKLTENNEAGHEKIEEKGINNDENGKQVPITDNDDKVSLGDLPSEKSETPIDEIQIGDQPEDATSVKRKRFSLKRLFRRSPKKNEKRSKEVLVTENLVTESDEKMTENVEAGHENIQEKGIIGDENEKKVSTQEPITECPANDIKIGNEDKLSIGDVSSEKLESPVDEIQNEDQPEDDIVSVKRKGFFLKRLFKRSPKKNAKVSEVLAVTENLIEENYTKKTENNIEEGHESVVEKIEEKEINDEENGKEVPAQEPINECSANDINIVDHEELPKEDLPSEKSEPPIDEIQNGDQPEDGTVAEKHKGFSLKRLFRRSPKKNEKPLKAVSENNFEAGHESGVEKIEEKGINDEENGQQIPTQEPNNENSANDIKIDNDDKLSIGDVPSEKSEPPIDEIQNGDQPEDGTVAEKSKRFTLKMFFRRSPKKKEKVSEVLSVTENLIEENDTKKTENNEAGHESAVENIEEKGINDEENGHQVPTQEPNNECPSNDINIVDHEELPKEDVPVTENLIEEYVAKDAENIVEAGHENVQEKGINGDENGEQVPTQEPNNDDKLSVGDVPREIDAEKSELPIGDNENIAAALPNFDNVNENGNIIEIEQK